MNKSETKRSVFAARKKLEALLVSAMMMALAFALSYVKVWQMPWGGSVTLLSMLPICMISLRYGLGWGLGTAFCYSCLQVLQGGVFGWGLTPGVLVAALLLDYLLAFTVLGLAGLFRSKGLPGILSGIALVIALRFGCHLLSGYYLWTNVDAFRAFGKEFTDQPMLYSLCYNGMYMLPELLFTVIAAVPLFSPKKLRHFLLQQ